MTDEAKYIEMAREKHRSAVSRIICDRESMKMLLAFCYHNSL